MKTAFSKSSVLCVVLSVLGACELRAAAFQNGSFETPTLSSGGLDFLSTNDTSVTGWTSTGNSNVLFNNGNGFAVASAGNQGIILNGNDGNATAMSQTFDTLANEPYTVKFDLSRETGAVGNLTVSVIATGGVSTNYSATPSYLTDSYSFTSTGTSTTLTFSFPGFTGASPLLDNVQITAAPEPSTLILCGLGALGLFISVRRRKPICLA